MLVDANILTYFKSKFLFNRIENILSSDGSIRLLESTYLNEFLTRIENLGSNITCVIVDDCSDEKDIAFELAAIRKVLVRQIPILMISSGNNTSFFSKAITLGVDDIVIKPFTDDFLRDRILKLINNSRGKNVEIISLGLFKYLKGEFLKARKGNYSLTFMLTTLKFEYEEEFTQKEKIFFLDSYFDCLKGLFWDTDLFIKFNSRYYLGVFPFCDVKNAQIIYKKNAESFETLIEKNVLPSNSNMAVAFVSYPDEFDSVENGFLKLMEKIQTDFSDYDLEVYFSDKGSIKL